VFAALLSAILQWLPLQWRIYDIIIPSVCPSLYATRKCVPYMGTLAAAGCTLSVCGEPGYAGKWAGLARRSRWTPRSWAQRAVRAQWGLSQRACASTGGFLNGRCASTAGFLTLQFKPQLREARLWLVKFKVAFLTCNFLQSDTIIP